MKQIKMIDFFKWGNRYDTNRDNLAIFKRYHRNFFFYALAASPATDATGSVILPEYLARFLPLPETFVYSTSFFDKAYFTRSAYKIVRPEIVLYFNSWLEAYKNDVPEDEIFALCNSALKDLCVPIYYSYAKKWEEISNTYFYDYDPIENYNMTERLSGTDDLTYGKIEQLLNNLTHGRTGSEAHAINLQDALTGSDTLTFNTTMQKTLNLSEGLTGSDTLTHNTTDTRTPNLSSTETEQTKGFNSSTWVDTNKRITDASGTETNAKTGTETTQHGTTKTNSGTDTDQKTGTETTQHGTTRTNSGSDTLTYNLTDSDTGTATRSNSGKDEREYGHELTRKGNIGVTTSQQMIQQQRELLLFAFLNDVVFPDIDKALTLSVY